MLALALFTLRRVVTSYVPVLVAMSILVFAALRLIPGDAVSVMTERMTLEQQETYRRLFGLDQPIMVQYLDWASRAVRGDLGVSLRSGRPVVQEIALVLPATLELGLVATLLGVAIGVPVGVLAAVQHNTLWDRLPTALIYVGISLPEFWIGTLVILVFSLRLQVLPAGGYVSLFEDPWAGLLHVIGPALVLGLVMAAFLARVVRSTMLEVLRQDYLVVARAKELAARTVLLRHALRSAAATIVTLIALQFAYLISGSIVVEEVFVRPGLGRLLTRSIFQRDYAVVQGIALLFALLFTTVNLAADLLRGVLDPRVRE